MEKRKETKQKSKMSILKNYLNFNYLFIVAIHTTVLANADQVSEGDVVTSVKQISGAIQTSNVIHAIAI